ncbi:MAG: hypothetical protein LBQ83_01365 [Candidatus Margulisbacteria bacterium]|jgi:hypothetical protein|nr:hypothetical protein [Candidatus Margulisiibacteriota bacterium]
MSGECAAQNTPQRILDLNGKKFSIGLSSFLSYAEYKILFEKWAGYIDCIYFSPPGPNFQTRHQLYSNLADVDKFIVSILNLAKAYNIKQELALNNECLTYKDIVIAKTYVVLHGIYPDVVVCNAEFIDWVSRAFPETPKRLSVRSMVRSRQAVDRVDRRYSEIVMGTGAIKNPALWKYAKESGFKVRVLLNSACDFNCPKCPVTCNERYAEYDQKMGINNHYALTSILPGEFKLYYANNRYIDNFKLDTRNFRLDYIAYCLGSYLCGDEKAMYGGRRDGKAAEPLIYAKGSDVYALWGAHSRPENRPLLDYAEIIRFKEKYWRKIWKDEYAIPAA